jgi:Transposase, Mutator family.
MEALGEMMDQDAHAICGPRHARGRDRRAHRWGRTRGKIGFHGGKVDIERPRLRGFDGMEHPVPSWEAAVAENWLGKWAMNLMLINVSTRKFGRAVRLPEGDVPAAAGAGLSKSAASRRFVALSAGRMKEWMAADLSGLDLLVVQIDGIHLDENLILVAAIGVDAMGDKHPLGLIEGATENAATVQALIDNLSSAGSTRRWRGCSSSMAPRPCRRRSGEPSAVPRRYSGVRFTRPATSWTDCPKRCTPQSAAYCDKPGN